MSDHMPTSPQECTSEAADLLSAVDEIHQRFSDGEQVSLMSTSTSYLTMKRHFANCSAPSGS